MVSFADLSENPPSERLTKIDQLEHWNNPDLGPIQKQWARDGVVILKNFMNEKAMKAYEELREKLKEGVPAPGQSVPLTSLGGWKCPTPYMKYKPIRDLCLYHPLMDIMHSLIGHDMGLHLNLTGWVSTERSWHQDDYLNPDFIMAHYAAVWIALDDISPDCGPFEWVPGSHKWPLLRRDKILRHMEPGAIDTPDWPTRAEKFVTEACQNEIDHRGFKTEKFLAKRGDVLIWHGRLMHQGSKPNVPGMQRKALIAHYSALAKRTDMPKYRLHKDPETNARGYIFDLPCELEPWEKIQD